MKTFDKFKLVSAWQFVLEALGIDYENDPNFTETPERIARMYTEIFAGLLDGDLNKLEDHITKTFPSVYSGIVAIKNIQVWGTCPHHFLPVDYVVNVGYLPGEKVLGASKIPRVVELLAQRPVLQEDLTMDIVNYLERTLQPKGVIAQVKGRHHCMIVRGIKKADTWMSTSSITGVFHQTSSLIQEFENMP
jgi:GTP cyclohydrolase I